MTALKVFGTMHGRSIPLSIERNRVIFLRNKAMMEEPSRLEPIQPLEVPVPDKPVAQETVLTLEPASLSKEQLHHIKKELEQLVDTMTLKPSILSRIAALWGTVSFWPKLLLAALLSVPIIIGFVLNSAVLIPVSISIFLLAMGGAFLLENHTKNTQSNTTQFKSAVTRLANTFGKVIGFIDGLKEQLKTELVRFQDENHRLTNFTDQLKAELSSLNHHCRQLEKTMQLLNCTKMDLERTTSVLTATVEQQHEALDKRQVQLDELARLYNASKTQLAELNDQLFQIKTKMGSDLEKAHLITLTLQNAVSTLANSVLYDKEQKKAFLKKLERFIADKDASFDKISERIVQSEHELARVTDELKQAKDKLTQQVHEHETLVLRETGLIDRLQKLTDTASANGLTATSPAALLPSLDLYSPRNKVVSFINTKEPIEPTQYSASNSQQ